MTTDKKVPELLVEQLAAGELEGAQRVAVEEKLREEGGDRISALKQSNEEILQMHPSAEIAAEIRRRVASQSGNAPGLRWRPLYWIPAAAAVGAVLVLTLNSGLWRTASPTDPDVQPTQPWVAFKGAESGISIHLKDGDKEKMLSRGQGVREGDVLQVTCESGEARNAVILSVDGAGAVTLHYPAKAEDPTAVQPGRQLKLPFGYELDDAPGFERFVMVWTAESTPLNVQEILSAAKHLKNAQRDPLVLAPPLKQVDFLLLKTGEKRREP